MSFSSLFDLVQNHQGRISTKWLTERAIELSTIKSVKEEWSSVLDPASLRGFYIEGPLGPPVPLKEHESLIGLSREMVKGPQGAYWRRLIYTKELMHVFDLPEEKADTPERLNAQIERFSDPTLPDSPQHKAEEKALWRALAVLCQAEERERLKAEIAANRMSIEVVATELRLPTRYVRELMRDDFEAIIANNME